MYQIKNWQLRWLGHDGFQLSNGTTALYVDPFKVGEGKKADYILITHEHYDHFDPDSIGQIRNINTVIIGPESVTTQLDEMAIAMEPGEQYEVPTLTVRAVAAYNTNKKFHPKEEQKLGFIIEIDGVRIYHAGDTDLIPEMGELGPIDLALVPVSGTYVMTADEAAEAVKLIKPKVTIPMHYGAIVGSPADAKRFAELAKGLTEVVILEQEVPTVD